MALLAADLSEAFFSTESVGGKVRAPVIAARTGEANFSLPKPEEGHRLISAFFNIREPALRKAIIELVGALSTVVE